MNGGCCNIQTCIAVNLEHNLLARSISVTAYRVGWVRFVTQLQISDRSFDRQDCIHHLGLELGYLLEVT